MPAILSPVSQASMEGDYERFDSFSSLACLQLANPLSTWWFYINCSSAVGVALENP